MRTLGMASWRSEETQERDRGWLRRAVELLLVAMAAALATAAGAAPGVGDAAPDFELQGSDGKTYRLEDLTQDHAGVVLAWFPKAFTPG